MISSMTGFSRCVAQGEWGQAIWEIRTVNHRYLDLNFKLADNFSEWEQSWRHLAGKILHRGKIDCYLTFVPSGNTSQQSHLNKQLVEQLVSHGKILMTYPGVSHELSVIDLLRWPEVLRVSSPDLNHLKSELTDLFEETLKNVQDMRLREGKSIAELLIAKLNQVLTYVRRIKTQLPDCKEALKAKIMQRIEEVGASLDPQRLEQELVLYVHRMDVEEEMDRLETHTKEAFRMIDEGGAMGRRLDFLMQEMGREANTLTSKSLQSSITQDAIEIKVLIEQMREQIQNVE